MTRKKNPRRRILPLGGLLQAPLLAQRYQADQSLRLHVETVQQGSVDPTGSDVASPRLGEPNHRARVQVLTFQRMDRISLSGGNLCEDPARRGWLPLGGR